MSKTITYATPEQFKKFNTAASREKRNRSCYPRVYRAIRPGTKLPVTFSLITGPQDSIVRCRFTLNAEGQAAWLDLTWAEYESLGTLVVPEPGVA